MLGKKEKGVVASLQDGSTSPPQRLLFGPPPIATAEVGYADVSAPPLGAQNCHLGQLKLFYTLLEFLTLCTPRCGTSLADCLVVYIGSAPGTNIIAVSALFPEATFLLYDPRPFDPRLQSIASVHMRTGDGGMVSPATCTEMNAIQRRLGKRHALFISDIRVAPTEEKVMRDLLLQQAVVLTLHPLAYQLKFRLPYLGTQTTRDTQAHEFELAPHKALLHLPKGATLKGIDGQSKKGHWWYLGGEVYTQLYPPPRSTETRLVGFRESTGKYGMVPYNIHDYENTLNAFNLGVRALKRYPRAPLVAEFSARPMWPGWQPSYEATCELAIWDAYHTAKSPTFSKSSPASRATTVRQSIDRVHAVLGLSADRRVRCAQATAERAVQRKMRDTQGDA